MVQAEKQEQTESLAQMVYMTEDLSEKNEEGYERRLVLTPLEKRLEKFLPELKETLFPVSQ